MTPDLILAACSGGAIPNLIACDEETFAQLRERADGISIDARVRLIAACAPHAAALPLLVDHVGETGFFIEISNAFLTTEARRNFTQLGNETGIVPWPVDPGQQRRALGSFLGHSRVWMWVLSTLFGTSVLAAIPALVADREWRVRLEAVKALQSHIPANSSATAAALGAVSDSRKAVREEAIRVLREQLSVEEYESLLEAEEERFRKVADGAERARKSLGEAMSDLPGIGPLFGFVSAGASGVAGGVANLGRGAAGAVAGGWARAGSLFRGRTAPESGEE